MGLKIGPLAVLVVLILTGCAGSINPQNAAKYANAANSAAKAGDWTTARGYWAKAVVNAELAGAPPQQLAVLNYEYGRSLGIQCFWDESEKYLLKAFDLDHQTGGPEFMSLVELSRLKYDQKQYDKAVVYFERTIPALQKAGAPAQAPAEFAAILDEYAAALKNAGKEDEAKSVQGQAAKVRADNPQGHSITDRTPYGTQCAKEK
jgi:tetratricopeptide (TPR) repeat protein